MAKRLKALTDLSLRKAPLPACGHTPETLGWDAECEVEHDPLCAQEHNWKRGVVFTPPAHMSVEKALARGIAEEVGAGG